LFSNVDGVLDEIVKGLVVQEGVGENGTHGVEKRKTSNLIVYKGANAWDVPDVMNNSGQCHEGNNGGATRQEKRFSD
jgi:hypothetical protein